MLVKTANIKEIDAISSLHMTALPCTINSMVGKSHLATIYNATFRIDPKSISTIRENDKILGVISHTPNFRELESKLFWNLGFTYYLNFFVFLLSHLPLIRGFVNRISFFRELKIQGLDIYPWIMTLAIDTNTRGKGLGSILLSSLKYKKVFVDTSASNQKVINFYQKNGFKSICQIGGSQILCRETK